MASSWLLTSEANSHDFLRYESHGKAHFHEMVDVLRAGGLEDFAADVVIDLATGRGDAFAAACAIGAVSPEARVVLHDHAAAAGDILRSRFGNNFEFATNESIPHIEPVAPSSRVLVICSHLFGQCDSVESREHLEFDLQVIANGVAVAIKDVAASTLVSLEPGTFGPHFHARTSWRVLLAQAGLASKVQSFRVSNRSNEHGIQKSGTILTLAKIEDLIEIDPSVLRQERIELDYGFGAIVHEAIDATVFELNDGVAFAQSRYFLRQDDLKRVAEILMNRQEEVRLANAMNAAILGLVP